MFNISLSLRNKLCLKGNSQHKNENRNFLYLKHSYKRENNEQEFHMLDTIVSAKPIKIICSIYFLQTQCSYNFLFP